MSEQPEGVIIQDIPKSGYEFAFNDFLKQEFRFGIPRDRPLCKAFAQGHCPLGNSCPNKHHNIPSHQSVVCKHWMRALCKKGEHCEFLHQFNLRKAPECVNFSKYRNCPNGDDCMYQHLDGMAKLPPCPHFDRGFCPLGPLCSKKHVKKENLCPFYIAGFCPDGKQCKNGAHARFPINIEKPTIMTIEEKAEQQRIENVETNYEQMADMDGDERGSSRFQRGGKPGWQRGGKRGGFTKRRG